MWNNPSTIHISIITSIGSFIVSGLSIYCGYLLILHGTTGITSIEVVTQTVKVNFFSFVPGVSFALFGAGIAWKALNVLIKK